jgi:hypothetical protein
MTQRTTAGESAGRGERKAAPDASARPSPAAGLRRGIPVDPRPLHKSARGVPGTLALVTMKHLFQLPFSW